MAQLYRIKESAGKFSIEKKCTLGEGSNGRIVYSDIWLSCDEKLHGSMNDVDCYFYESLKDAANKLRELPQNKVHIFYYDIDGNLIN